MQYLPIIIYFGMSTVIFMLIWGVIHWQHRYDKVRNRLITVFEELQYERDRVTMYKKLLNEVNNNDTP